MADIAATQDLVQRAVDRLDGVERRKVLASEAWFTRGSLFALVSRPGRIVVRLPDEGALAHWEKRQRGRRAG